MVGFMLPFNFNKWIDEHRHLLKPPVGAKLVFEDANFIVMVVGGPNKRSDYHINMGEEDIDKLRWYCDNEKCRSADHWVYEESFHVATLDLGKELKPVIERYYSSEERRTCKRCGHVNAVPRPNIEITDK